MLVRARGLCSAERGAAVTTRAQGCVPNECIRGDLKLACNGGALMYAKQHVETNAYGVDRA
jgi:hypothetical protein